MPAPSFRLLDRFEHTFLGTKYRHRDSSLGNKIGRELFEDLILHRSDSLLAQRAATNTVVVNSEGKIHRQHRLIRRNDSVMGLPPAGVMNLRQLPGCSFQLGPVADPHIACEVKIVAKSQAKQIDRVLSDLRGFAEGMKRLNERCINIAIAGVNHESNYVGYEGKRAFRDALRVDESANTESILGQLTDVYDELLILPFKASNQKPYPFSWLRPEAARLDYGAVVTRMLAEYEHRFR